MTTARVTLSGSTVLLSGATGGIGHAIARALAARGARLILTGRRSDVLQGLAAETGGRAVACDLADREAVARLAAEAAEADVLVANAALPASGELTELTQEQIDRMLEVNLRAPIALARALAPEMAARGSGHLVFINSLSGKTTSPASSLYSATKFGLRGFALGAREDLRDRGVGVSTIFPGFIRDAGMFADTGVRLRPGVGTRSPDEVAAAVVRAIDTDRAEIDVAPFGLRAGAALGGLAPAAVAAVTRRLGSHDIAAQMAKAQRRFR
ncbi:MAG TPA: SDR family NAD(P)-dependent oxidoreductase [Solirubrobacteraceae bacterium]|nr:SDR family NAD(P)-dependent oxidoreductase [Solirubrobacteraceae bacterium]